MFEKKCHHHFLPFYRYQLRLFFEYFNDSTLGILKQDYITKRIHEL